MAAKSKARLDHESDLRIIADRLRELAEDHEFCDLYYTEIDKLNERLSIKMPVIRRDRGTLDLTISFADATISGEHVIRSRWGPELNDEFVDKVTKAVRDALQDTDLLEEYGELRVDDVSFDFD